MANAAQYDNIECEKVSSTTICEVAIRITREANDRFAHGLALLNAFVDRVIGPEPETKNDGRKPSPDNVAAQLGDALAEYEHLVTVLYGALKRIEKIA